MIDPADIKDEDSLKAWLEDQPQEVSVWIAARAAARDLPVDWAVLLRIPKRNKRDLTGAILRGTLTSTSFVFAEDADSRSKVAAAAHSAYRYAVASASTFASGSAARAASAAARAASASASASAAADASFSYAATAAAAASDSATDAASSVFAAADAAAAAQGVPLAPLPLWAEPPGAIEDMWQAVLGSLAAAGETEAWAFWIAFYESLRDGRLLLPDAAQHGKLLIEIATSDSINWDDDAAANAAINEIWMGYVSAAKGAPRLVDATPFDFTLAGLGRVLKLIGLDDEKRHLKDPKVVQSFVDDAEELREGLQDFCDYARELQGGNFAGVLRLSTEKVLQELAYINDQTHLRPGRIVMLGSRLEQFSLDKAARDDLGSILSQMLDQHLADLRRVCRKHFGPTYAILSPLSELSLEHIDRDEVVRLFDDALAAIRQMPNDQMAGLNAEAEAVLQDMCEEVRLMRAAIDAADTEDLQALLEQRFAQSSAGLGLTLGRFYKRAAAVDKPLHGTAKAVVERYETVRSLLDILGVVRTIFTGDPPPGP